MTQELEPRGIRSSDILGGTTRTDGPLLMAITRGPNFTED